VYCAQCGTECPSEYKFCKNCGGVLPQGNGNGAATSPGAPPQPVASPTYPGQPQVVYYATPQAAAQAHTAHQLDLLKTLRTRLQAIASTEDLQGFSLAEMFSEVFKRRSPAEVEDYLLVGTSKTTPPIDVVETGWPKPWLFFRVLAGLVVAFVGFTFTLYRFGSLNHIPAILMVGAFAVPMATLTFFFEMNTPRNVSVQRIATLLLWGAVVSLLFAMIGYSLPGLSSSPSLLVAGIVEECAKLATVILVIRSVKYKYILNGLLFGATVGAAFAAFETAGYAMLNQAPYIVQNGPQTVQMIPTSFFNGALIGLLKAGGDIFNPQQIGAAALSGASMMISELRGRAIDAPFTHIAWTAIAAAALWRVKKDQKFRFSMLKDPLFLKAFMIPIVLHTIWDFPYYQLPYYGNEILCGFIAWYVLFGLIQQGLRQVQQEQRTHLQTTLNHVEASLQSAPVAVTAS
jgi:RsiW-degrading membrane proteinase PrsW (M82 family)